MVSIACRGGWGWRHSGHRAATAAVAISWVNSAVLMEAMERYEQGRLPQHMRYWLQAVLELNNEAGDMSSDVLLPQTHPGHRQH